MSASKFPFPVKERNPKLPRYNLPRFTHDEYGRYVMDTLRTEDLPTGPPNDADYARKRFLTVVWGVALLAGAVAVLVCVIVASPSALFGWSGTRGKVHQSSSNATSLGNANASSYPAIHANEENSLVVEDADTIVLFTSSEAMDVPAAGPGVSKHSLE